MEENLKQQTSNCIKIVVFGPESTGKTTLATQLVAHYNAVYVPEYARIYAAAKKTKGLLLTEKDVLPIAEGQMQLENTLSSNASSLVICDTDLLETKTYASLYYPTFHNESLTKYANENTYNLYFLTYIDVPWKADGIRDMPMHREQTFMHFQNMLETNNKPYVLLRGSQEERLQKAITAIDKVLKES